MERVMTKVNALEDALATVDEAFESKKKVSNMNDDSLILMAQDSIIKRFEYTFDCFWKMLKLYLEEKYNLEDVNSPKSVFRACVKYNILRENEGLIAIDMVGDRNETSHRYDRAKADQIAGNVEKYYALMTKTTKIIKSQIS